MAAQSEATPTPASAKIKEWLGVAAGAATVAALIIAGMFGAIKLANAPCKPTFKLSTDAWTACKPTPPACNEKSLPCGKT